MLQNSHEHFMNKAMALARQAFEENEVPIGAIVVSENGQILGKGYNQVEKLQDPTAHAEMIAITAATETIGAKYLRDCRIYITLEPCAMCAGAISWAQIDHIIFGAHDPNKGFTQYKKGIINPKKEIIGGILESESNELLKEFFFRLRT